MFFLFAIQRRKNQFFHKERSYWDSVGQPVWHRRAPLELCGQEEILSLPFAPLPLTLRFRVYNVFLPAIVTRLIIAIDLTVQILARLFGAQPSNGHIIYSERIG